MAGVHAKIAELNERLQQDDVRLVPYLDRSNLVEATVEKVSHTVFQGIGLVFIVLLLFLGSPRSALIVGITVPFAMCVAFALMNLTNIPANLLSLGAIDFGIIVDGAIVMCEAILRRREAKPTEPLTEADALEAALQVARPIFFSPHHNCRLYPAVRFPTSGGQAVLANGLCSRLRSAWSARMALTLIPGLAYLAYRRPRRLFHNPVVAWLEGTIGLRSRGRCGGPGLPMRSARWRPSP